MVLHHRRLVRLWCCSIRQKGSYREGVGYAYLEVRFCNDGNVDVPRHSVDPGYPKWSDGRWTRI